MRLRLRSERGMALPTALFAMIAAMALASAAIMSSVDVQQGTARDHNSKEAIAAADAGASMALLRLNRFQSSLSTTHPCVGPAGELQSSSAGWCPSTAVESVGGATYTYRVSAYSSTGTLNVIAVGTAGTVSRRIEVSLYSEGGKNIFAEEKLIGQDNIRFNGNAHIETSIGTNGEISPETGGSFTICGSDRHGIGKKAPAPSCGGQKLEGERDLPPVVAPTDITTNNSDCRLAATCQKPKIEIDPYTKVSGNGKKEEEARTSKEPWEASSKTINVNGGKTLTMGGRDYLVCKINLQSGKLIMAAGSEVRIFVDTPEHCGLQSGATQVEVGANANISSTGFNTEQGTYSVPGIYLLGNGSVKLSGNSGTNELILYAPESEIKMDGSATWIGMMAGKTLEFSGGPTFKANSHIQPPNYTVASLLRRTRYVECTGATATTPSGNC